MSILASRRSSMVLYSGHDDLYSHRTRIVLAEKGVSVDVVEFKHDNVPQELLELNPYGVTPTLVDRDLVIYHSRIIMEYLDERFPHPPLLPVYPVMRAKARLLMYRVEKDWYPLVDIIYKGKEAEREKAAAQLRDALIALSPLFQNKQYFLEDEFSLVDASLAPIFWRLPLFGIKLPPLKTKALLPYMDRLFARDSFQASLTEYEREIRE